MSFASLKLRVTLVIAQQLRSDFKMKKFAAIVLLVVFIFALGAPVAQARNCDLCFSIPTDRICVDPNR